MGALAMKTLLFLSLLLATVAATEWEENHETPGAGLVEEMEMTEVAKPPAAKTTEGNPMLDGIACKLRSALEVAEQHARGKKALAAMVKLPVWQQHKKKLDSLLDCVKDKSTPIGHCSEK